MCHAERMPEEPPYEPARAGRLLASEESVYGLVLVAGMIIVSSHLTEHPWDAVTTVAATVAVFFAAHVYAGTVSRMARAHDTGLRVAFGAALHHSIGLVAVAVIPLIVLAFGASGVLRATNAVWAALVLDVMLLGLVGWLMAAARTDRLWMRVGGALVTAAFGGSLIALKVVIHI